MSKSSNKAKQRFNSLHYVQVKASIKPEIANAFKATCATANVSIASTLSDFMADYSKIAIAPKDNHSATLLDSRRKRRLIVKKITSQMEQLLLAEENYLNNIPENLQGSKWHDASEQSISVLQEIIDLFGDIY